jgi:uncharacterized secreted protein with C-terminal beta-propeller domain
MPRPRPLHVGAVGLALAAAALGTLTACTGGSHTGPSESMGYRLVSFNSCDDALSQIRTAAKQAVGPYGLNSGYAVPAGGLGLQKGVAPVPAAGAAGSANDSTAAAPPAYSGTNTQEVGVDEPDLVKTDGRRIIVVHNGVLEVIDPASHTITGTVDLFSNYGAADLLLSGDHALVLSSGAYPMSSGAVGGGPVPLPPNAGPAGAGVGAGGPARAVDPLPTPSDNLAGPHLILVDLSGQPHVLARLAVEGSLLDARQTGSIARIVVNSAPRISFPSLPNAASDAQRTTVNRSIIDQAPLSAWLPRIDASVGSATKPVTVGCGALSATSVYSGSSLVTILTVDLAGSSLADPQPLTIMADAQNIYSDGASLYLATDQRWRGQIEGSGQKIDTGTTIYQFDTTTAGRPSFVAGGSVPGYLVNQYAMSARNGYLRVATTSGNSNWESNVAVNSQSGVYVLRPNRDHLDQVGRVEGLGKGEKIYAVRFLDNIAYVVTFKQTDPLYTVDLSDPTNPTVRGELRITGYSSYLHPIAGNRVIGIGQDVNSRVQASGTQVSLFDVSQVDNPSRLAVYQIPGGRSNAEYDPHAFLYWPATGLLVVPLDSVYYSGDVVGSQAMGVLVLRISGGSIERLGFLSQPVPEQIQRSLVIGQTLWTVSNQGLMGWDITTLEPTAWVALA